MIQTVIEQQNMECVGGFIAMYADPIMAHVNPNQLRKHDIAIIIKVDGTIWGKRVTPDTEQNQVEWLEIERSQVKLQKSPLLSKVCYFKIKKGNLFGTYIISEDFIRNEQFSNDQSYLDFITK